MATALYRTVTNRKELSPKVQVGPFRTDASLYEMPPETGLRVTWFGHSSVLVEIDGARLLIDPVWDQRASPVTFAGPKRFFPPTLPLDELPPLDAVLLSHDHFDHLGAETVTALARSRPQMCWFVPLGVGFLLRKLGVAAGRINELDWTETAEVAGIKLTAVPARHFSGRSLSNRNETLWMAFGLRGKRHNVFCGADSGWWPGFEEIGRTYGPFDLTMLEIGAYDPLWADIHMGPDGAVRCFEDLGGGVLMPIHWGLFDLAFHGWREPMERLTTVAGERGLRLFSPEPGLPQDFHGTDHRSAWWRR